MEPDFDEPVSAEPPTSISPGRLDALSRELSRDLPCVRCAYDLVGLSVRDRCPECGTPVRATLLSVVDPLAGELAPIHNPRLLFAALCVWSICTLLAALCVWIIRALEFTDAGFGLPAFAGWFGPAASILIGIAGVALVPIARPHDRLERGATLGVVLALLAYLAIATVWFVLFAGPERVVPTLYVSPVADDSRRSLLRLLSAICCAVAVTGLSRVWRTLQSRSVLMRSGRLDRQSTPSMLAALSIAALGDVIWLLFKPDQDTSIEGSLVRIISIAMIGVGSMLLTVGVVAIVIDVIKLRPVILAAPLTFDEMTRPHSAHSRGSEGRAPGNATGLPR